MAAWARSIGERVTEPTVVVGYSLGGRLALHLLLESPKPILGAVLIGAHPGLHWIDEEPRQSWENRWAENFQNLPWLELQKQWQDQKIFKNSKAWCRSEGDFDRSKLVHALRAWSPLKHNFKLEQLMSLPQPLLWLAGSEDQKYQNLYRQLREQNLPGEFQVLPNAGHRLPWGQPQNFVQILETWLSDIL